MSYQIITFYEFKDLTNLAELKDSLRSAMSENEICGTIIIASEGFNSTVCGKPPDVENFIKLAEKILQTRLVFKSSFHPEPAFKRRKVKIKSEIVTLRKTVDVEKGRGTHVSAERWNEIISDPETFILDARNDYECRIGSFRGAVNPETESFSQLPDFVEKNLHPSKHKRIAMFCTGGIRCEKFAPFLREKGFGEVYQLEGGILRYLEEIPAEKSLWEGECFVFDERISVDESLKKGEGTDLSQETKSGK
ncbi:MAG: rhodanese-like domain-containing protein [Pyrinomonadaceae bacterium]